MAIRSLSTFGPPASGAVIDISRYCGISTTPPEKRLRSNSEKEMGQSASEIGLGCVRGTTLALAFELVTVLAFYVVWQLCHLAC